MTRCLQKFHAAKVRKFGHHLSLENAVENHFTAKPPRTQRTYSKNKSHPFGEAIDHLVFDSDLSFSLRLCALAVEV
jgi:hypothetical protein